MYRPNACYNAVCLSFLLLTGILATFPDALLVPVGYVLGLAAPYIMHFEQVALEATLVVLSYPIRHFYEALGFSLLISLLLAVFGVPDSPAPRMKTKA